MTSFDQSCFYSVILFLAEETIKNIYHMDITNLLFVVSENIIGELKMRRSYSAMELLLLLLYWTPSIAHCALISLDLLNSESLLQLFVIAFRSE